MIQKVMPSLTSLSPTSPGSRTECVVSTDAQVLSDSRDMRRIGGNCFKSFFVLYTFQ